MPPQSDGTRGFWFRGDCFTRSGETAPRPAAGQARRFLFWGIILRLDWEWLREGRLKVARGRSWQPEIGMEHASRGRRSGNKGVGARWRGRFRIFSARHCSRTKVSHAENSGMTMLFFSLEVAPMSEGDSFTRSGVVRHACRHRVTARGVFGLGGIVSHARERRHPALRRGRRGGFCFGGFFCGWTGSGCGKGG